jgi:hypothetical protein
MRRLTALFTAALAAAVVAGCGTTSENVQQDQVGSTEQAVQQTPTGVANCGNYPLPRRMSQYVNLVEVDALPAYVANPIDSLCKLAVATLIESVPGCETGTPEDQAKVEEIARVVHEQIESGVPPDQAYALIRTQARDLAKRKAC